MSEIIADLEVVHGKLLSMMGVHPDPHIMSIMRRLESIMGDLS